MSVSRSLSALSSTLPRIVGANQIVTMHYRPGSRLCQILARSALNKERLGGFASAMNAVGGDLISLSITPQPSGDPLWVAFLDLTAKGTSADSVSSIFESKKFGDVIVVEGQDLLIDRSRFPLELTDGERVFALRGLVIRRMFDGIRKVFGSGGDTVIYQEGLEAGKADAQLFKAKVGTDAIGHLQELTGIYAAAGLGIVELVDFDFGKLEFRVRVYRHLECEGKESDHPVSQWMRGHLAGSASELLGSTFDCVEEKCIACGDSFCEFAVRPA